MATAELESRRPGLQTLAITVKGWTLVDPYPGHPEAEFIYVRHPFNDKDVHKALAGLPGLRMLMRGLDWVSEEIEEEDTTKCLLVGYTHKDRVELGDLGPELSESLAKGDPTPALTKWICAPRSDSRKLMYVVSPVLPIYRNSCDVEPTKIPLYAMAVECSGLGRPFRVHPDWVYFRQEYRTNGVSKEERLWTWLNKVGAFCRNVAEINPAPSNGDDLQDFVSISSESSDSTYLSQSSEKGDGLRTSVKCREQDAEDNLTITDPTNNSQESPLASEELTPTLSRIGKLMEEEAMASDVQLVNKWVKRVQETTTEIHGSGSPAAQVAASQVWTSFFKEFKKLSKKSLENLREYSTATGSNGDE